MQRTNFSREIKKRKYYYYYYKMARKTTHCFLKTLWQLHRDFYVLKAVRLLFFWGNIFHIGVISIKCNWWSMCFLVGNLFDMSRCTYIQTLMILGQTRHDIYLFKYVFSTVCYSAPLWPIDLKSLPWPSQRDPAAFCHISQLQTAQFYRLPQTEKKHRNTVTASQLCCSAHNKQTTMSTNIFFTFHICGKF